MDEAFHLGAVIGEGHACAIKAGGTVVCWGSDSAGQATPPPAPEDTYSVFSSGDDTTCAVKVLTGTLQCWGRDQNEQANPLQLQAAAVATGHIFGCALSPAGELFCWPDDFPNPAFGELPAGPFSSISAGDGYGCGVGAGAIECWGSNEDGQASPPLGEYVQVSTGPDHACAVRTDRKATCWGRNDAGETVVAQDLEFVQVTAGLDHSCGVLVTGQVTCWGANNLGQLEVPETSNTFKMIEAGDNHTCGLVGASVVCWGDGSDGKTNAPGLAFSPSFLPGQ